MTVVLVTGAGGQIGHEVVRASWPASVDVVGLDRSALDIADQAAVMAAVDHHRPAAIVNAAAYTDVDRAEHEPDRAFNVNATAVGHLADGASLIGCTLIHLSTDYVFDGAKDCWYIEEDPTNPVGAYGRSKLAGELEASKIERHLVLRTSWVYGAIGSNFVRTMLRLANSESDIRVVDDQIGCPTAAPDIAQAICSLVMRAGTDQELAGTYHLASPESATWYEFASAILERHVDEGLVTLHPVSTDEYPTPAARPPNSRLDSTAIERVAGIRLPDWTQSLPEVADGLSQDLARSTE